MVLGLINALFATALAQDKLNEKTAGPTTKLSGKLIDAENNKPIAYASVVLYAAKDSSLISGSISSGDGTFSIEGFDFGKYYLIVKFVGYKRYTVNDIHINPKQMQKHLGELVIERASQNLSEVEVVAEQTTVEYKIDRKVVNVGKDISAKGGTAIEALENVPSVTVDIEGNVELRGSGNFTVLIDGRPSPLSGSDALDQIPVSQIKNIEIITNPSAKYDPEGMTGIINIVTKDNVLKGISGLVELGYGTGDKYNANGIISYRNEKFNVYLSGDYRDRRHPGTGSMHQESYFDDTTFYRETDVDRAWLRQHYSVKTGFDYFINKKSTIGIVLGYRDGSRGREIDGNILEYTNPASTRIYTTNYSINDHGGPRFDANIRWDHKFDEKGHKLMAYAYADFSDDYSINNQYEYFSDADFTSTDSVVSGIKTVEDEIDNDYNFKIEYERPLKKKMKFEAGTEVKMDGFDQNYKLTEYDNSINDWSNNPKHTNRLLFNRDIYSVYTMLSDELKTFGYQIGLRAEYLNRFTRDADDNKNAETQKFSIFPTLHFSKSFKHDQQVLLSYSRRINRPNAWYLEPFPSYMSSTTMRVGNPNLQAEYIDNYELSYKKSFSGSFVSLEAFYRTSKDKITRIQTVNDDNITVMNFANIDDDQSLGIEFMTNLRFVKWMNINLSGNFYNYQIQGSYEGYSYDRNSNNHSLRGKITFKFLKKASFEISNYYVGPTVTATGRRAEFWSMSSALNYRFLDDKLALTFRVRDMFNTMKYEMYNEGVNFVSNNVFNREGRVFYLSATYKINNYNKQRQMLQNGGDEGGDDFM